MAQEAERGGHTVATRTMELVVSGLFMAVACVVMYDNWRTGVGWSAEGPEAGYFPFFIGLLMFVVSAVTFGINFLATTGGRASFVERPALVGVLKVLVPTVVYVVLIGFLGLYVSSAIFIAFFMAWLGKYRFHVILPVAILIPVALFFMFDVWFLVPLPKGPLETALGF